MNVALHVVIGVALALALHERWVRARGLWRALLILPWAVPNYITCLIWQGMFQRQYGAVNALLETVGLEPVSWFSHFATAFGANLVTNTWLGFPFMMVVALGALAQIPRELHEAAAVDGAGAWARFRHVTLPHLLPAMFPAILLGSIWTFNMFNVIFLVSEGKPGGATDILVTQAYRWAFERGQRFGMAAAYATIIFVLLGAWTWVVSRRRRRT
jgi:arabinogalactan oligomer/maltooligosaccharide transport system permease protein